MAKADDDLARDRRFGDELRQARTARGRTQDWLADKLGVDQTLISAWERGGKVPRSRSRLEAIEAVLDVRPPGKLTEIVLGPYAAAPASVPAFLGADRLTSSQRDAIQRLVDEMIGPE